MSEPISIKITDQATEVLARAAGPGLAKAIAAEMDKQNQLTLTQISTVRMRGNDGKPFSPSLHILGIRTGQLYKSLWATDAAVTGNGVRSAIGSNLVYAGINEFGGTIQRQVKPGSVKLRTNAAGELIHQPGGRGAVFASQHGYVHKRFKVVKYDGGKRFAITIPERAPVRSGIEDRADDIGKGLSVAVINYAEGKA